MSGSFAGKDDDVDGGGGGGGGAGEAATVASSQDLHCLGVGSASIGVDEPDVADETTDGGSLARVDSLTLALKAIQTGYLGQHSQQENSGNSLNSSTSGSSQLGEGEGEGETDDRQSGRPSCKRASSLKVPGSRPLSSDASSTSTDAAVKKAVRFADALGLDLALVRHVFDLESPPEIPPQAMRDLVLPPSDDSEEEGEGAAASTGASATAAAAAATGQKGTVTAQLFLSPSFAQPGSAPNFNSRIAAQKVVLERAHFQQQGVAAATPFGAPAAPVAGGQVRGVVRVANLGFEKSVRVRASLDSWRSSFEVAADYVTGAGSFDQFAFAMSLPDWLKAGDRVLFCVSYTVNGETYWDNNFGDNYAFHCVTVDSTPRFGLDQSWTRYV